MSSDDHTNYRPRSPDLSAFTAPPPPPPPPHLNRLPSYHENSSPPNGSSLQHRGSYDASPFFSPSTAPPTTSYFASQPHAPQSQQTYSPQDYSPQESFFGPSERQGSASQISPPSQRFPQLQSIQIQAPFYTQRQPSFDDHPPPNFPQRQPHYSDTDNMPRPRRRKASSEDSEDVEDSTYAPNTGLAPGRSTKKRKSTDSAPPPAHPPASSSQRLSFGPSQGIDVKTKFPVARIKRIMQADEDVGKVAQATPTAVSKALELFMITLVTKGAAEAKLKNSKRVTSAHLKAALMKDSQFDFLEGICATIPDATEKKSRGKSEDQDSEEGKKGKGTGRRKKAERSAEDSD